MKNLDEFTHFDLNAGYLLRREEQEAKHPNPIALQADTDYDLCSPAIQCNADKIGASVYLVHPFNFEENEWTMEKGRHTTCRVLDFSQKDADSTFQERYPEIEDEEDEDEN